MNEEQKIILTDAGIFAVKLWVDGIKDIVLGVACIGAALIDVLRGRGQQGFLFYRMMRWSKRVDQIIDLYGVHDLPEPLAEPEKSASDPAATPRQKEGQA
jgi:hypothetical protein